MSKGFHSKFDLFFSCIENILFVFIPEKPSKRVPAKRRYKIEKKVREHNRKLRKEMKKKNFKAKRKDPGIPNSLPFKEQILNDLQEHKKRAEEIKEMQKINLKRNLFNNPKNDKELKKRLEFETLLKNAEKRTIDFETKQKNLDQNDSIDEISGSNLKSFYKDVQKVIEASDVIIQVVDARDPLGTRCFEIEDIISKNYSNKKMILLINKCDLIPRENLIKWLNYFKKFVIVIPFKACTQNQKQNLSTSKVNILVSSDELLKSAKCLGMDQLMKILNSFCHNKDVKTSITVGIVGLPNVGKSSILNSLKRNYVCNVGPTPGLTRCIQTVSLDKKIKLIDSPGIVFSNDTSSSSILALRNALNIDKLKDPILPVQAILNRVNPVNLMKIYNVSEFNTVEEFLRLIAKRYGKMSKGCILDLTAAAKIVLNDWNNGKLKYYTLPPETNDSTVDIKFLDKMPEEFNIEKFDNEIMKSIDENDEFSPLEKNIDEFMILKPEFEIADDSPMMESNKNENNEENGDVEMEELDGMQLNRTIKKKFKKLRKQKKKSEKMAQITEQASMEDYDFDTYF